METVNINKPTCIKLNRSWQPCGIVSPKEAIVFLCSEHNGERPGFALDFESVIDENGDRVLVYANPVSWEDWLHLPVRDTDLFITTSRGKIRLPIIIICAKYNKVPVRAKRLSNGNIWERDRGICQYTGEKVTKTTGNIDHIRPRDRGGKDTWENMVVCKKDLNSLKSNKLNREVGLKLIREPKAPVPMPVMIRKADAPLPEQTPFLMD